MRLKLRRALPGRGSIALLLVGACSPLTGSPRTLCTPVVGPSTRPLLPPAPAVTAQAQSPFAVRIAWPVASSPGAGFEVELESDGHYRRVAQVSGSKHEFVHHLRLPGQSYRYRVRELDTQVGSASWLPVAVTMPERTDESSTGPSPPPCITLPPARDPAQVHGQPREVLNEPSDHPLYDDPERDDGLLRHLIGQYEGCFRDFGTFQLQGGILVAQGFADEGWPLLHAIAGAGQRDGAQILTLRFSHGRYTVVDEARLCGEELAEGCQQDTF